ncbi:MAG: ABC transporter ATP-binding protein [Opitutus sp.]|nr:ABC transporter ATP-binding protein [Opitutus sp.]MCS6247609.1 ABC transporter ATP-binding protein [Opitutus sp.]MCS6273976.1 ABC transporter ATP-binding protein [Opitutus sp.]MCS6277706.1 ABC transporter ATP-binding protein [Opitutus sp.]MCS6299189.1 ABC transporter ATP-binding protein [Opitutus sp.]
MSITTPAETTAFPTPGLPAVHLRAVDKSFRNGDQVTPVLKQVDLTAFAGEMMLLVGPSGCGKTTLLSVLCGTLQADAGHIEAFGQPLSLLPPDRVTRFRATHVGFVFQQFNLLPTLTAAENVAVPLRIQGLSAANSLPRAREMLARVGLSDKAGELPNRLSGGQQQRVAIARALVHDPALIVCDEPTSALDSVTGHQVMDLLRGIARDGRRTIIVVTHDPRIYRYADCMAEMEDGRIIRVLHTPAAIAAAHRYSHA